MDAAQKTNTVVRQETANKTPFDDRVNYFAEVTDINYTLVKEYLKELHLTEGRNTGFKKILDALRRNGSPLPEFETDEDHDYFITRLFVREGFYGYEEENVVEGGVNNGVYGVNNDAVELNNKDAVTTH